MKIAILGYGVEGRATHRFLKKKYPKAEFAVLDKKRGTGHLKNLAGFDAVYRTPGIPFNTPEIQKAVRKGVNVTSASNLFFEEAKGAIIGVTGTKGKGTTATLIRDILKAAGRDVHLGGNIGTPMLTLLPKLKDNSVTVLELSSFQLQGLKYSPHIAVILGVFPEHLDHHKNFREYVNAKAQIVRHQKKGDLVFYDPADKYSRAITKKSKGEKVPVTPAALPIKITIPGRHNLKNAAMAAGVASRLGISPVVILETIKKFRGLPYRLEYVRTVRGVEIYNDSASTNPQTTVAAIEAFPGKPKILIAGGRGKNLDYKPLGRAALKENVKLVVLYGEDKKKMKGVLSPKTKSKFTRNVDEALDTALGAAETGNVIIFSPAATSFDMFENYVERAEYFANLVKKLKG